MSQSTSPPGSPGNIPIGLLGLGMVALALAKGPVDGPGWLQIRPSVPVNASSAVGQAAQPDPEPTVASLAVVAQAAAADPIADLPEKEPAVDPFLSRAVDQLPGPIGAAPGWSNWREKPQPEPVSLVSLREPQQLDERQLPPPSQEQPAAPVPAPLVDLPAALEPSASGPISLKVQGQDIRRALELISEQGGSNIIPSIGVSGTVDVNLQGVTFDEALDVLMKAGSLKARREGHLVYVYTKQEYEAIESGERQPETRVYHLNYLRAVDLAQIITPFLSSTGTISITPPSQQGIGEGTGAGMARSGGVGGLGGSGGGASDAGDAAAMSGSGGGDISGANRVFSAGSSVGSSTGGNSFAINDILVVRDFPENLQSVDDIVKRLDTQPLQVLIEAVILSVELTDGQDLGVNFGLVDNLATVAAVGGSGALLNAAGGFIPARVLTTGTEGGFRAEASKLETAFAGPDHGLKFGFVDRNVSGFIRALESLNKIDILASPRVMVLNKQKAEIQLGRRLGFRNTVTNLTSSLETVQFLSVGTLLSLRPFVSADGMVRLEIHPEKSTGFIDERGIPQTNTSELTTNILVPDGATIVIGGLIDSEDDLTEQGILGLSRMPVLGPLFRARGSRTTKKELIVLLTPRVIQREGLPRPAPGLPPAGPSGVPNSGPMPGLSFASGPGAIMLNPRPAAAASSLMPQPGASSSPIQSAPATLAPHLPLLPQPEPGLTSPSASRNSPVQDPGFRPTSYRVEPTAQPAASPASRAATPTSSPVLPQAPATEAGRATRSTKYRPGDLTRAAMHWIHRPRERLGGRPAEDRFVQRAEFPQPMTPPVSSVLVQHTVMAGESFGSIAQSYFGSPTLGSTLWHVNRHLVPAPDQLAPGTTILIPPLAVLQKASIEADRGEETHSSSRTWWPFAHRDSSNSR